MSERRHVVFSGGRSGVGKSGVVAELLDQLVRADVRHCVVEGDNLDLARIRRPGDLGSRWRR